MNKGLVSIIIPIYNGEKWLKSAVYSALHQTYKNIEVILVDDGSTDGSLLICKELAKNERVFLYQKSNGGQSSARNVGLDVSRGEFIQFLDCDDTLEPNACELTVGYMKPDTDFVLYGFNIYRQSNLLRTPHCKNLSYCGGYQDFKEIAKLLDSPCNKLYRRSYIKTKFREGYVYGEDGIFNYDNLTAETKIECIEDCLYNVNLDNPDSVNKRYKRGRLINTIESFSTKSSKLLQIFGDQRPLIDYVKGASSTIGFTITLCAARSTYTELVKELKTIQHHKDFLLLCSKSPNCRPKDKTIIFLTRKKLYLCIFLLGKIYNALNR